MNKTLLKTALREIRHSFGRFVSITCIIALGVGFYSGLNVMLEDMTDTADNYYHQHCFYDYKLMNTLGFDDESVASAKADRNVLSAEGAFSCDAVFKNGDNESVLKVCSQGKSINTLSLKAGRLAENENECVADAGYNGEDAIGKTLVIADTNDKDTLDSFSVRQFKIVGIADSPVYLNYERGTSKLGNGTVSAFIYTVDKAFTSEYYTEIYLKLNNQSRIYSDEYDDYIAKTKPQTKKLSEKLANDRYESVKLTANDKYNENYKEYEDNLKKYKDEKKSAEDEIKKAQKKLSDSESQLQTSKSDYESGLKEYENGKKQYDDAYSQYSSGLSALDDGISQTKAGISLINTSIGGLSILPDPDGSIAVQIEELKSQIASLEQKQKELEAQKSELTQKEPELKKTEKTLRETKQKLDSAKAKLDDGRAQLESGKKELESKKAEAESKFADAQKKLDDAKTKLDKAKKDIDDLKVPESYTLGRDTNVGYVSFESDSAIVDGIAAVFPVFFFLVAALMCMTTMKRMVEEQRTDIGTMKALGYSKYAILSKYIIYAAAAGIIGATIGFFGFSVLFPKVIWFAYGVIYNFAPIVLNFDWLTGGILLVISLLCTVGTTVLSSIGTLNESAAQIMRPKTPKSGKRLLFENTAVFKRLGFLRKVSIRNMVRYRQRFIMMVLGVAGCTALLVTGLGVRDSIQKIGEYQFGNVQTFDYSVTLSKAVTPERKKAIESIDGIGDITFLHSLTYDIKTDNGVHSAIVVAPDDDSVTRFVNLVNDGRAVVYPSNGQAVISRKFADKFGLKKGSTVTVCDSDGKQCPLTVSDICENYVDTYVYTTYQSLSSGFKYAPEIKTAYADKTDNADVHAVSARLLGDDDVINVTVNSDIRDRVAKMLSSMDYIVLLIIACAGALAFVVIYNLTNINITERIREIATIKVLGFYKTETAGYVFSENYALTAIGALLGLLLGKLLHAFVMSQIDIDKVAFNVRIAWGSYILSIVLTFVFAVIVMLFMIRKIDRIDMAQSLKSIE